MLQKRQQGDIFVLCITSLLQLFRTTKSGSCAGFLGRTQAIVLMVFNNPTSYSIFSSIQGILSEGVTCSEQEIITLDTLFEKVEAAVNSIEEEEAHIQSTVLGSLLTVIQLVK